MLLPVLYLVSLVKRSGQSENSHKVDLRNVRFRRTFSILDRKGKCLRLKRLQAIQRGDRNSKVSFLSVRPMADIQWRTSQWRAFSP